MEKYDYGWEIVELCRCRRTTVVLEEDVYNYLYERAVMYGITVSDLINLDVHDAMEAEYQYNNEIGQEI